MLSYKSRLQAYGPLPDIWGEGAIFAFSGIDGPTCSASNFVLTFDREPFDLVIHTADPHVLRLRLPDSGHVSVEPDGISIGAFGTSESAGWSDATLIVAAREGRTATVDFVACRPEMAAQVLTPIQAQATLDLPPDTSRIIIRARTNSMTVDINSK